MLHMRRLGVIKVIDTYRDAVDALGAADQLTACQICNGAGVIGNSGVVKLEKRACTACLGAGVHFDGRILNDDEIVLLLRALADEQAIQLSRLIAKNTVLQDTLLGVNGKLANGRARYADRFGKNPEQDRQDKIKRGPFAGYLHLD